MKKTGIFIFFFSFFAKNVAGQIGNPPFISGGKWNDKKGHPINAHGAGILYYKGTYYMFGEIKKGKTRLVPNQTWEAYRVEAGGVSCYASKDLLKWKYKGLALKPNTSDSNNDIHTSKVIERPKVVFNKKTKKFVMWMHIDKEDYSYAHAGVAYSDKPEGPYEYIRSIQPNDQASRDITLFRDDDGKAYLIYASENNNTMQICLLSDDYLYPTEKFIRIFKNQRREAPALFKRDGKYFLITSFCNGWDPNPATYAIADSIMGTWEQRGNPCLGPDSATTFHAQSTYVLPIQGKVNAYIFMADRWNKLDLAESRYLWLPLQVNGDKVEIKWVDHQ